MKGDSKQRGIGLIEVLVAVLVLAIGLVGIAALQGNLLKSGNNAKARAVATTLAQEKIEDLRSFTQLVAGTDGTFGWAEIGTNAGGTENADGTLRIPNGTVKSNSGSDNISGVTFNRTWTSTNYYSPPVPDSTPVLATNWNAGAWGALPTTPNFKEVVVTVNWTEPTGEAQQVAIASVVNSTDPQTTGKSESKPLTSQPPQVPYRPLGLPDVVSVPLDVTGTGRTQEASKPEPTVFADWGSVVTRFDEVVYDERTLTQWRNAFATVSCVCETGRSDGQLGRAPTVLVNRAKWMEANQTWINDQNISLNSWVGDADLGTSSDPSTHGLWVLGDEVSGKAVGKVATGRVDVLGNLGTQPAMCDVCCRDHHDKTTASTSNPYPRYDRLRPSGDYSGGDHKHYKLTQAANAAAVLTQAGTSNDWYLENCRMFNLDGFWRVAQDWMLQEVNLIPESWLTADHLAAYQDYVKSYVTNYVVAAASGFPPDSISVPTRPWDTYTTLSGGGHAQFLARGIYIDYMGASVRQAIAHDCSDNDNSTLCMARIPFHEVNLTKLAHWTPTGGTLAVSDTSLYDRNRYPEVHSRGYATQSYGCPIVQNSLTYVQLSNSGLTDTRAIDPDDATTSVATDLRDGTDTNRVYLVANPLPVCDGPVVVVKGVLSSGLADVNINNVTISAVPAMVCSKYTGNTCTNDHQLNLAGSPCYQCTMAGARNTSGSLTVSTYNVPVSCQFSTTGTGNNKACRVCELPVNNSVSASFSGSVTNDGTRDETTGFLFIVGDEPQTYSLNLNITGTNVSCPTSNTGGVPAEAQNCQSLSGSSCANAR